jgi:hypothetical protein
MRTSNLLLSLIVLGGLTALIVGHIRESRKMEAAAVRSAHLKAASLYQRQHWHADDYWMSTLPPMDSIKQSGGDMQFKKMLIDKAMTVAMSVGEFADVSPLAGEIAQAFPGTVSTVAVPGGGMLFLSEGIQPGAQNTLTVCFIPADQVPQHQSALYFSQPQSALMMAAIRWPTAVAAGAIVHEAGHALRFRQHAPSSTASGGSDLYLRRWSQ